MDKLVVTSLALVLSSVLAVGCSPAQSSASKTEATAQAPADAKQEAVKQEETKQEATKEEAMPQEETAPAEDTMPAVNEAYLGTYEGTLPCADCEGIKTKITFNKDTTYDLEVEYIGTKEDMPKIVENGVYKVDKDILTTVTPGTRAETNYKVQEDGNLVRLSATKELPPEDTLPLYVLKKAK